jgi:hypothetical protein
MLKPNRSHSARQHGVTQGRVKALLGEDARDQATKSDFF